MNRGQRNNNPLNIRHSADQWQGAREEQTDPAFVQFKNDAWGYRAAWRVLQTYSRHFRKHGMQLTIKSIIQRWAPPSENHTEAYIRSVSSLGGLGGNELLLPPFKPRSFFKLSRIMAAMTCVECGISLHDVDMESICRGYRLAFPENNEKLSKLLDTLDEYSEWG